MHSRSGLFTFSAPGVLLFLPVTGYDESMEEWKGVAIILGALMGFPVVIYLVIQWLMVSGLLAVW
ncbi:hypothetical protein ES703_84492 [subsurface metagenome]